MKNVFVILTSAVWVQQKGASKVGPRVCINMSRCQEMWANNDHSTKLVMNIPNCEVIVMESIDVILQKLDEVNREPSEQGEPTGRTVGVASLRSVIAEIIDARRSVIGMSSNEGTITFERGKIEGLEYLLSLRMLQEEVTHG